MIEKSKEVQEWKGEGGSGGHLEKILDKKPETETKEKNCSILEGGQTITRSQPETETNNKNCSILKGGQTTTRKKQCRQFLRGVNSLGEKRAKKLKHVVAIPNRKK